MPEKMNRMPNQPKQDGSGVDNSIAKMFRASGFKSEKQRAKDKKQGKPAKSSAK